MSQEKKEQPNPLGFLDSRRTDEKMGGINKLMTSDKDNETKTRIPNVFGMSVLDLLGAWSSPKERITTTFEGKDIYFPKTVEGLSRYFGFRYRINAISYDGRSRDEYVAALRSYLAQQEIMMQSAQNMRMEEGVKGKQK